MWNLVRKSKGNKTNENAININTLKEHFRVKFDAVPLNKTQSEALDTVNIKYDHIRNTCDDLSVFSVYKVRKYIKQLRLGCAPGAMDDGITAEHMVHGLTTDLHMLISCLLTVCIRYGIVPDAFFRATLVIGAFGVYRVIGHVGYSRTATIVFSSLSVWMLVCLFVCPGLFSDTVNPTVTMPNIVVTYVPG